MNFIAHLNDTPPHPDYQWTMSSAGSSIRAVVIKKATFSVVEELTTTDEAEAEAFLKHQYTRLTGKEPPEFARYTFTPPPQAEMPEREYRQKFEGKIPGGESS